MYETEDQKFLSNPGCLQNRNGTDRYLDVSKTKEVKMKVRTNLRKKL